MKAVDDLDPDSKTTVWDPTFSMCPVDGRTREPSRIRTCYSEDQNASSISATSSARESSIPASVESL